MTKRLAEMCTDYLIGRNAAAESKRAVLVYGLEVLIATVIGVAMIAVLSLAFGQPLAWLFFLLAFVPLRRTAGGYHADTHFSCYLVFASAFAVCLVAEKFANGASVLLVMFVAISFVVILLLSPCVPDNKPLSTQKRYRNRQISVFLGATDLFLAILFLLLNIDSSFLHYCYYGVLTAAVSLVAAKIKIYKKEKTK